MALFEIDNEKLIPAQFGRKVHSAISENILRSVRNQVLQVIDRPLLPVAWLRTADVYKNLPSDITSSSADNQKRLVSFDLSGQLVIVEVVSVLDSKVLTNSLSFLSRTSSLVWKEIASFYPGGVQEFASAWMKFREQKPVNVVASPRLILVVDKIESSMRPALDILLESGLAIYELDLRTMNNGRTFLDVTKVTVTAHRSNIENMLLAGSNVNVLGADLSVSNTDSLVVEEKPEIKENEEKPVVSPVKPVTQKIVKNRSRINNRRPVASAEVSKPKAISYMEKGQYAPVQFDAQGLAVISAVSDEEEISLYLPAICKGGAFGFLRAGEIHAINAVFDDANKAYIAISDYFMVTLDSRIHPNSGWDAIKLGAADGPSITEAIREINYKGKVEL
ncbi:hypothetical protein HCQ94_05695 [Actinomyces sp. zg-332]|uniref:hypothetical protein n=1 Tax=Actinomyces sp. zg-332 TaxID=2708340 RepID=UPI0014224AE6|nr:hypothetical protein [Actinomyces sp. zg-332]QPK94056.1 hypothetical protein HCQ94_05695 [Actinomyces sp. zg-332]